MKYSKAIQSALASTVVFCGGIALGQNQTMPMQRSDQSIPVNANRSLEFPPGFINKDIHSENAIKSELGTVATDLVEKNHFDNLVDALVKQDKTRVGDFKNRDVTELNNKTEQFRAAWKAKYGKEFDLDHKAVIDDRFAVLQGEVSDPALALNNWPVAVTGAANAIQASQIQAPADNSKTAKEEEKDAKLDKGRNAALVRIPAGDGFPEMTVSMLHELPDMWRIDIPNDRTGQQIYDDVLKNVSYLNEHISQLPADVNDAYRVVARSSLAALYGVERQPMSAMQQQ